MPRPGKKAPELPLTPSDIQAALKVLNKNRTVDMSCNCFPNALDLNSFSPDCLNVTIIFRETR